MAESGRNVMLTGVTGLLGGAIALELLKRTDDKLFCLVRSRRGRNAEERMHAALKDSARVYGIELSDDEIGRCSVIAGDITDLSGFADLDVSAIDAVWHVAASLAFEEDRAAEIAAHNIEGTKNVIDLARRMGAQELNYVSTAYVAGSRRGMIAEERVTQESVPNNVYESTKAVAESVALDSGFATVRIFRPSIVIGHSRTYGATTFTGLYGFVRGLERARDLVRESLGDLLRHRPLRLLADGSTPVNFIPVDYVAESAVKISLADDSSEIYHLANSTPPTLANSWDTVTEVLAMKRPLFVTDSSEFTLIDQKVDEQMNFYRAYMNDEKYFDVTNSERILGEGALACALSPEEIANYVHWYLKRFEAA